MRIKLIGAATLEKFTDTVSKGLIDEGHIIVGDAPDLSIIQIHGSPQSLKEDLQIIDEIDPRKKNFKLLIHRPDEVLLCSALKEYFSKHHDLNFVFLGDLPFLNDFWRSRISKSQVIPHPFMDYFLPNSSNGRSVIGSHTSWGEMRKLEHFLLLVKEIKEQGLNELLSVKVGGTLNGYPLSAGAVQEVAEKLGLGLSFGSDPDCDVRVVQEFFVPHFNVQLYHLNGRKRFCESSGSLHRGVSIPVIFEANGMERLEGLKVVKVPSSDDLLEINFNRALQEISNILQQGIEAFIDYNNEKAKKNSPKDFAKAITANF